MALHHDKKLRLAQRRRRPVDAVGVAVMVLAAACGEQVPPLSLRELVGPVAEEAAHDQLPAPPPIVPHCGEDMVLVDPALLDVGARAFGVAHPFCIDRYEAVLRGVKSDQRISPYYAPNRKHALSAANAWEKLRFQMGSPKAQQVQLPAIPRWELQGDFSPRATSVAGVVPNGHVSGKFAQLSCENAGKRLCIPGEWRLACGGQHGTKFPYGNEYIRGKCNVFREAHPAHVLHGDASIGHADPRLNRVRSNGRALLRKTGATPECASSWGADAVYDMVGNLDEWVDDKGGVFAGGFYARSTKDGCRWRASGHPYHYADYSTGVRCCSDLPAPPPSPERR